MGRQSGLILQHLHSGSETNALWSLSPQIHMPLSWDCLVETTGSRGVLGAPQLLPGTSPRKRWLYLLSLHEIRRQAGLHLGEIAPKLPVFSRSNPPGPTSFPPFTPPLPPQPQQVGPRPMTPLLGLLSPWQLCSRFHQPHFDSVLGHLSTEPCNELIQAPVHAQTEVSPEALPPPPSITRMAFLFQLLANAINRPHCVCARVPRDRRDPHGFAAGAHGSLQKGTG